MVQATIETQAEVILDGTLGTSIALPGPDFEITADLGQQQGINLFHSFSHFNLNKEESATFSGPPTINNIIGRMTGSESSQIDGKLRSNIHGASLYLINPNGFIFGPNARLEIDGSFHVSSASEIKLGNLGQFSARHPEKSLLISAPPSAFGFLDAPPAAITIKRSELATPEGRTLSLSAGELNIEGGHLTAVSGTVNLVAMVSGNWMLDVPPTSSSPSVNDQLGKIALSNNASIDVGKQGAGDVYIRSGQFVLERSDIVANTGGEKEGGVISLNVAELHLTNGANIDSRTFGPGNGGHITVTVTGEAVLANSHIFTTSHSLTGGTVEVQSGRAGDIVLKANRLEIRNGTISTTTYGNGQSGDILIEIDKEVVLSGSVGESVTTTAIQASSEDSQRSNGGNAGRILIKANQLNLIGNSKIDNSTLGSGQGGNINLQVKDTLSLQEGAIISADSKGAGKAGNIRLNTSTLKINHSTISTATEKSDGGNVIINAHSQVEMTHGTVSATVNGGQGNGGNVAIGNPHSFHFEESQVIANASNGQGGFILIITGTPLNAKTGAISASSETGTDGEVKIDTPNIGIESLPVVFLDASILIKKHCPSESEEKQDSFVVEGRGGIPNAPDDLQPYTVITH